MDGESGPEASGVVTPEGHGASPASDSGGKQTAVPGGRRGEGLSAQDRLLRRADFLKCYRTGRRRMGALVILYFAPNSVGQPRMGITASRKVGKAVVRQRLKRRIRELYRRWPERATLPAIDLVVHLKPEANGGAFDALRRDLGGLLRGVSGRGGDGRRDRRDRGGRQETRA
jgi:ribonuclease P protein component